MSVLLFFKGELGGVPAQPNEMTDGGYGRWTRPPGIGDTVHFMGGDGKILCSGEVSNPVRSGMVKIAHCGADEWIPWDEQQVERDTESGAWIVKTPLHAAL